jgi:hypothetical protein
MPLYIDRPDFDSSNAPNLLRKLYFLTSACLGGINHWRSPPEIDARIVEAPYRLDRDEGAWVHSTLRNWLRWCVGARECSDAAKAAKRFRWRRIERKFLPSSLAKGSLTSIYHPCRCDEDVSGEDSRTPSEPGRH